MSDTVIAISILTQMIANLSVRHHPPHDTIRVLQKNLDKLTSNMVSKGE